MMIEPARLRGRPRRDSGEPSCAAVIQSAALGIFTQKGYDVASTREIAAAANVDAALIAYQFGSKLGLWKAVVSELSDRLFARLAVPARRPTRASRTNDLRNAMLAFIDFAFDNPDAPRFLMRDARRGEEHSRYLEDRFARPLFDHFLPLMEEVRAEGRLRTICPEMAALHFCSGVAAMMARQELLVSLNPRLANAEAFRSALCDTLVEPHFHHG